MSGQKRRTDLSYLQLGRNKIGEKTLQNSLPSHITEEPTRSQLKTASELQLESSSG
jgi:hypothetical protein